MDDDSCYLRTTQIMTSMQVLLASCGPSLAAVLCTLPALSSRKSLISFSASEMPSSRLLC